MPSKAATTVARDYATDVVTGEIVACKWTRLACQRHLDDLDREGFAYKLDRKKAQRACDAIQLFPHIKGKWAGKPLVLEPWQIFIVVSIFGWVSKKTGLRRFRTAYIEVPRKNAKSTLSSAIALYMMALDGEGGAEVYSAATTRDQARIVFRDAQAMARRSPEFREQFGVEVFAHSIAQAKTASRMEALSAEGNSLDGLNVHCAVIDELHAHKTRAVFDVIETATGAREQSLLFLITTAGFNRAGICYEQRGYLTKILEGVATDDTYFGVVWTLDTEQTEYIFQSSQIAGQLEKLCKIGCVSTTKIDQFWREECVKHVTTATIPNAARGLPNVSTLIDLLKHLGCVEAATRSILKSKTQNTGGDRTQNPQTGKERTKKSETRTTESTDEDIKNGSITKGSKENLVLAPARSKRQNRLRVESAKSAERNLSGFALITATKQVLSEVYFVNNATLQLACLETMKRVYNAHSPTCEVREKAVFQGDDLVVTHQPDDWTDPKVWAKANPNYGVSVFPEDIERTCAKAMQMAAAQNNFLTKRLNVWVNADTAWMDMRAWDRCADPSLTLEDFKGKPCFIGLDLASKIDIAAKIYLFPEDREVEGEMVTHFTVFGQYYLPQAAIDDARNSQYAGWEHEGRVATTPGDVLDFSRIEDDLLADALRFQVNEIAIDPWQATQLIQRMESQGANCIEYRNTVANFSSPMKEIDALARLGRLHHDGDPVLAWMVSNVVCHIDAKENIYPRKEREENKIDGLVALIMALGRAMVSDGVPKFPYMDPNYEAETA